MKAKATYRLEGMYGSKPEYSHQEAKAIFAPVRSEAIKEVTSLFLSLVWVDL